MQILCALADPASATSVMLSQEDQEVNKPITASDVFNSAEDLLDKADLVHLMDDELLRNR